MAVQCVIDVSTMGLPNVSSEDCWPEDDEWDDRRVGVGLSNLGNTCYQNSIIQCLLHNKSFVSKVSKQTIICEDSIAHHFIRLSQQLKSKVSSVIRAEGIRDSMAKRHSWLGDGRQHDAQEFLVLLLDQLHDQLKRLDVKRAKVTEEEDIGAQEWRRALQLNGCSPVSDTFEGQLCSSVTCQHCQQTSRSFEPFMYLCVPVPVSLETQLSITFCPLEGLPSTHEIAVDNKYESIRVLKDKLRQLAVTESRDDDLLVAEVEDFHVKRILDDSDDILSASCRLTVFQLNTYFSSNAIWQQNCPICLDSFDWTQLFAHSILCSSAVCLSCVQQLDSYGKDTTEGKRFQCHACSQEVKAQDFTHNPERSVIQSLNPPITVSLSCQFPVPLLFRSQERLVDRVHMLRVSAEMDASQIYAIVDSRVPWPEFTYRVLFVERDGQGCCRCSWGSQCEGCELSRDGLVSLLPSDTLCVNFPESLVQSKDEKKDSNIETNEEKELLLDDCLRAFITSETSEWFCAHCQTLRSAHKRLVVTRLPQTLIVSLKRFLFFGNKSHKIQEKIRFPHNLDLQLLTDGQLSADYRLRSVVLHSGATVSSGHYSAFVCTDQRTWLLCNDDTVRAEQPTDGDSRAYILFYAREEPNDTIDAILSTIETSIE